MPGTLVGTINWKSSFNPEKDGGDLCKVIENSCQKPYTGLTVFFLAEKHRDPFDAHRSKVVFEEFSKRQYEKEALPRGGARPFRGADFPHLVLSASPS